MNNGSKARNGEMLPWAPPRVGVPVERRDPWEVAMHGARAGLLAGVALGVVEIGASTILSDDPWLPFDFAAALIVGPEALVPSFPLAASLALGTVLHVLLSIIFGVAFLGRVGADVSAQRQAVADGSLRNVVRRDSVGDQFSRGPPCNSSGTDRSTRSLDAALERDFVVLPCIWPGPRAVYHPGASRNARSVVAH